MTDSISRTLRIAARLAIGITFIYAAVPKIHDPAGFARSIHNYQLLPDAAVNPLAIFLPWLEIICGIAVIALPRLFRSALVWLAAMLVIFIGAIASAIARGINIDCGCFSTSGQGMRAGVPHLLLDLVLLAAAVWALRSTSAAKQIVDHP